MILKQLSQATAIPAHLCSEEGLIMESSWTYTAPGLIGYLRDLAMPNTPVLVALPSYVFAAAVLLKDGRLLIMGPITTREITEYDFCTDLSAYPFQDEVEDIYRMIVMNPPVSTERLISATTVAAQLSAGEDLEPEDFFVMEKPVDERPHEKTLVEDRLNLLDEGEYHLPEEFLHNIVRCVREGNFEGFVNLFKSNQSGIAGSFSYDRERDRRYHFVYSAAIAHYASILGGLDYEKSCNIAEYFCKKMDERRNTINIDQLNAEMFSVFCSSVKEAETNKKYSPLVSSCMAYVRTRIHEKLYVSEIAEDLGVSAKWLSAKFREETGSSLVDYIHSGKILEAKHLLRYTTYNVAQISNILSYGSESYFIMVFRSNCGITPMEYRNEPIA